MIDPSKMVHVRIPAALWKAILVQSHMKGQSASAEIRRVLYEEFGEKKATEGDKPSRGA